MNWPFFMKNCLELMSIFQLLCKGFSKMPKNVSKRSFASLFDKGIIHQISYPHMLQLNFLCYQNARIDTLMLLELCIFSLHLIFGFSGFHLPLRIFGCVCYVHNLGLGFVKLDPHSTKCAFIGYSRTRRGY